jgi:predicted protein tyrosine phosphatase
MQYEIMNRIKARQSTYNQGAPVTAIISITDIGSEKNKFYPQEWLKEVFEIQFNDVNEGQKHCLTRKQADEIAHFARRIYDKVDRIIVHCEYGQSRSAAVAAAISKFFDEDESGIYKNSAYRPNRTCYYYVLEALRKRG